MVTLARLQKDRRRWMERKPRDPNSPHQNRLEDVLARMVRAGLVLESEPATAGGISHFCRQTEVKRPSEASRETGGVTPSQSGP